MLNSTGSNADSGIETLNLSRDLFDSLGLSTDSTEFTALRSGPGHTPHFGWTVFKTILDGSLPEASCTLKSGRLFFPGSHHIEIVRANPVPLDQIIVSFPSDLYDRAKDREPEELKKLLWPSNNLVRQGEFPGETGCRVRLCEPVDQGQITGKTTILIVKEPEFSHDTTSSLSKDMRGSLEEDFDDLDLEIASYLEATPATNLDSTLQARSFAEEINQISSSSFRPLVMKALPLEKSIDQRSIVPRPNGREDSESFGFVKFERLAKMGLFSGDIVYIETDNVKRPIQLFSYPEPSTIASDVIYLSPLLLFNMGATGKNDFTLTITREVQPHGIDCLSKMVPTCGEMTISRVASPITTERAYQSSFLGGLRSYFELSRRVICLNDVIAIPLDTLLAQTLSSNPIKSSGIIPTGRPDSVAWFKVTSICPENSKVKTTMSAALVDPRATRMVQSGLVQSATLPSTLPWGSYLGLTRSVSYDLSGGDFEFYRKIEGLLKVGISRKEQLLHTSILLESSKRGTGKTTALKAAAAALGIHFFEVDCYQLLGEGDNKTIGTLKAKLERAASIKPCVVLLKHIEAIARKSDENGQDGGMVANIVECLDEHLSENNFILTATSADTDKISEAIRSKFMFEINVGVPTEAERRKIFQFHASGGVLPRKALLSQYDKNSSFFTGFKFRDDVSIANLALQSAGLTPPDLLSIIESAKSAAEKRIKKSAGQEDFDDYLICCKGVVAIISEDFEHAITDARSKYSDSIGAPKIPNVKWSDVGGLEGVKKEILDTIEMPLKHPHLFSDGVKKRSGVLFYGPPGTGKTLLAKAIATNFSLNFFSVKGPELLNMYIGESEANVRKVFQKARDARPCVVFFDELDSVAPKRGNQGDSGGVMDRIVSQLLAELDGMSGSGGEGVFVVGATNRPDLLDEALLRPGRFDKMLYLGISDTHDKQRTILEALTRKFTLSPEVDLSKVAEKCSFTFTGADFYALCSDALLNAMTRTAAEVDQKILEINRKRQESGLAEVSTRWWFQNEAVEDDYKVVVQEEDFTKSQNSLVPSVSADELRHYLNIRENFEGKAASSEIKSETETVSQEQESELPETASRRKAKGKGKAIAE